MKWISGPSFALFLPGTSYSQVIVNAAFQEGRAFAPNSLGVAFGDFAQATPAIANSVPVPNSLGGVEVTVDGASAGIYFVSKTQVNFVIPAVAATQYARRVPVQIRLNGTPAITPLTILIKDVSPTVLLRDAADALRPAAALNEDGSANNEARPAKPGESITLYVTGYGHRQSSPNSATFDTEVRPLVYFRTSAGETLHSSPAAGQPGLWRVAVRIPQITDAPSGPTPIVVLFDGVQSNTASIWLR